MYKLTIQKKLKAYSLQLIKKRNEYLEIINESTPKTLFR